MVGAMADWFAVTALFRHPLGLPVPHTALVPKRKDDFGKSLEEFFAENFLQEQVIRDRLAQAEIARRLGAWLAEPAHAARVVREVAPRSPCGLRRLKDEDVEAVVQEMLIPRFMAEPIAPVAGGLLQEIVADDAHHGLVDLGPGGGPPLAGAQPGDVHRRDRRAGPVVGARPAQRRGHQPAAPRGGALGRRHPGRPAAPRPPRLRQPAGPARPGPAARSRHPGAGGEPQAPGARAAADAGHRHVAVERVQPRAGRGARRHRRPAARARHPELAAFGTRIGADEALRRRLDVVGLRLRGVGGGPLRRGADLGDHRDHRALGRPGGGAPDRAARRSRPAVHPDQRHHRRVASSACSSTPRRPCC